MKRINKLSRIRGQLSYLEKKKLEKSAKKDKGKKFMTITTDNTDYQFPSFVMQEITKFRSVRNFIFDNYKIVLDCKDMDKQIVNCSKIGTCSKSSCRRCVCVFSEVILSIDRLISNALTSLELFEAQKNDERNNLIIQIAHIDGVSEEHIKIMLHTRLDNIVANIHKKKIETNSLIVYLLNAKIRFIDTVEQTVKLYFNYYLSRISYYLENMSTLYPSTQFFSLNKLLDICNISILDFYAEYRKNANSQKIIYEKQGEFLHKTPLVLAIVRAEYATRGVLIDTNAANVDYKKQWVTEQEWNAFTTKLDIARNTMLIVNTEQEVRDEINTLDLAVSIFNSAKKDGSFVDTAMLVNAINIAEIEKNAVIVSDNSSQVYYKDIWVTQNELEQLNASIAEAKKKLTTVCNDEQVVITTHSLKKAIAVFIKAKKSGTYVDKIVLETAIIKAEKEKENVEISTTATNVDYKKMWVKQDKWESFISAIATAKNELSVVSTDDEVEEAANTLTKVIKDFVNAKENGNYIDKIALESVINIAETEIENISVSATGSDVDNKKLWVTQNEYETFKNILKNTIRIYKNATTDNQVLDATNKLKEDVTNFIKIKKRGRFIDKSLLIEAITNAENAQKDIIIDTDANNVDYRNFWVTRKEYDDLAESIIIARRRLSSVTTDDEVIKASDSLIEATLTFNNCEKKGTYVDKSILSREIVKAENSMIGVLIDTDPTNVSYKNDWVTQMEWDILANSIVLAQNSIKNLLTYKQVRNAAKRMRKAVDSFNKSKQKGTFVDTTILSTIIKNAEAKLEHISVDEDGTNVVTEHLWTTKEEWDLFNLAIEEARNAMDTVKNDEQVVEAVETLTSAIDIFDSVLKIGLMVEAEVDDISVQVVDNVKIE